ncbi:hypothetical protein cgR_2935 [Corynebacterium glutamicum R]|uniref:Uncharacterized protein n=1 Tax=Corynebacterium glutamicum (strain R) TaxID=340322 RepID=A0AB72VEV3_CORGB|nr:hypothetical protein cgR_2935 [Corynebacterium glutamicum R]
MGKIFSVLTSNHSNGTHRRWHTLQVHEKASSFHGIHRQHLQHCPGKRFRHLLCSRSFFLNLTQPLKRSSTCSIRFSTSPTLHKTSSLHSGALKFRSSSSSTSLSRFSSGFALRLLPCRSVPLPSLPKNT